MASNVKKTKNKTPAEIQITAEQLLREAKERDLEIVAPPPQQKISDESELADFQFRKRKEFEDAIRRNRGSITNYLKYAQWEESQKELDRARSVYERALGVDARNITVWLKYAEMETRNRKVNLARNLWDRAVTLLPRVNQFWYKYTYMEEMLENVSGARQVFKRWMEWEPDEQAWNTYINFELRYHEVDLARSIYETFVTVHPDPKNWIKYARFEERHGSSQSCRRVFERSVEFFGDEFLQETLLLAFARFEESQREFDRAKCIYQYAIEKIKDDGEEKDGSGVSRLGEIRKAFAIHCKKYGTSDFSDNVILAKRKSEYQQRLNEDANNYDLWFNYIQCVEEEEKLQELRDAYEMAIANLPLIKEKNYWRRYIYLWINYALMEEIDAENAERTREIYKLCLKIIPHKVFTFSKIWILYAQFEIRQNNLSAARKALGTAIGMCPKNKLFRFYIELELKLREFDRCRILYQKFLEFDLENSLTWVSFAKMETLLDEDERTRAIYELALKQPNLDTPEIVWKSYIDYEIAQGQFENARTLYERLLERTNHVKVWISYANFETKINQSRVKRSEGDAIAAGSESPEQRRLFMQTVVRRIFERANESFKINDDKDSRVLIFNAWKSFEFEHGDEQSQNEIVKRMPTQTKKRQKIDDGDGDGFEKEVYEYVFPDDKTAKQTHSLLLAAVRNRKKA